MEGLYRGDGDCVDFTPATAVSAGQVVQLPDGRCGVAPRDIAAGDLGSVQVCGLVRLDKTASIVILAGGRVFWDASANTATFRTVNDKDFYCGVAAADAASAATYVDVYLNRQQQNTIDLINGPALSVATGTAAAGGFGLPQTYGGSKALTLTATNEAQCVDLLSVDRVAVSANPIAEFQVRIGANGSTNAVDLNVGLANGTSTTDADAITEHVLFHVDGNALDLFAQSKDGTTTVTATDTTTDVTAGSAVANRFEFWIDARDPADIQLYVNGALVLGSTVFKLDAATGPIGLLAHLEKTSSTATAGPVYIDRAVLRTMD